MKGGGGHYDVLPQLAIPVLELVTDVVHDDVHPLEVERKQQESLNDSVPKLHVAAAPFLTYVEHVRYIVVNEEDTASSKDMPSTTVVHPHHIAVHKVPTTPFDASVTPAYAINSIPNPVPTVPAFVADSVLMNSSTGTQILLTDDAVPAAAASVSSSAPIASSLATPTHEVGLVQHSNPRNQHDMELSQRIKDCDKRAEFVPPYRTCSTEEPSPSAQ